MNTKVPSPSVYPKIVNHIGVSVPNLEEAVKWYKDILGFTTVKQTVEFVADDGKSNRL
jgi:catechol 2,3-dioxygenase-like lactoylglutathione lyase family enzyme